MNNLRITLSFSVLFLPLLASCGGSQPPIGAPGALPQSRAIAQPVSQNKLLPQSTRSELARGRHSISYGALLYVSTRKEGIEVLAFPQGKLVGEIPANTTVPGLCSDPNNGHVFVTEGIDKIEEYGYGGTTPIATLKVPPNVGFESCSVDPRTDDLAVAAYFQKSARGGALVYRGGSGSPTGYYGKNLTGVFSIAYDDSGNIFILGRNKRDRLGLFELPNGGSTFQSIGVIGLPQDAAELEWDGAYLTLGIQGGQIYQIQVSGSQGVVVNNISLSDARGGGYYSFLDGTVVAESSKTKKNNNIGIGLWSYPAGGYPTGILYGITRGNKDFINQLMLVAPPSD